MLFPGFDARLTAAPIPTENTLYSRSVLPSVATSGEVVDEIGALNLSVVSVCIRVITESLLIMPWTVERHTVDERGHKRRQPRPDHRVYKLLARRPNAEQTPGVFKQTLVTHALLWGNAFAEIERNFMGEPVNIWPIEPWRVSIKRRENRGDLYYEVADHLGGTVELAPEDVMHIPNAFTLDGITGSSCVAFGRETLGLAKAQERFGASWFGNGTTPAVVIEHSNEIGQQLTKPENLYAEWERRLRGPGRANKIMYLSPGLTAKPMVLPMEDAQFLASRRFQIQEICRWFRVQPHKAMSLEDMSYNNLENLRLESTQDSIQPWTTRLCEEADRKLLGADSTFCSTFDLLELQRGDLKAMGEYYRNRAAIGSITVNEVRGREGDNPIENGDVPFIPVNVQTLDRAASDDPVDTGAGVPSDGDQVNEEEDL